jgi:hypothetical protein
LKTNRRRLQQRRRYARDRGDGMRPRAARVSRGRDDVVVEVHVHNQLPEPAAPEAGRAARAVTVERPALRFSGELFSWGDHYHPLFRKIVPMLTERQARQRRLLARLARYTVWTALLAALTTLGCNYFVP